MMPTRLLSYCVVSLIGAAMLPVATAQPIPSVTDLPDEIVVPYDSPQLTLPPAHPRSGASARTAQLLGEAFARPGTDVARRVELMIDLGRTALPECVPFIRQGLHDTHPQIREAAATAAGISRINDLQADLLTLLKDAEPAVRSAAIKAHAKLTVDRTDASPAVLAGLKDEDPVVRLAAVANVANSAELAALRDVLPSLKGQARLAAIAAFERVADSGMADAVAPLLNEDDIGVRAAAIEALGAMKATSQASAIEAFLKADHPTLRRAALRALPGVIPADRARQIGESMVADPDLSVQTAAVALVAPVRSVQIAEALLERLSSPYLPLHDASLAALAQPADDSVRQAIIDQAAKMLDIPNARRRQDGSFLLGTFASKANLEAHIKLVETRRAPLEEVDGATLAQVAQSLGQIGDPAAIPALRSVVQRGTRFLQAIVNASGNPDDYLASAAVSQALVSLAQLRDPEIVKQAMGVLRIETAMLPAETRAAAAWALGEAGNSSDRAVREALLKVLQEEGEGAPAIFEAAKAVGRLKLADTSTELRRVAEETSVPRNRWVALWAIARITGQVEPYVTPFKRFDATVAIEDRTR